MLMHTVVGLIMKGPKNASDRRGGDRKSLRARAAADKCLPTIGSFFGPRPDSWKRAPHVVKARTELAAIDGKLTKARAEEVETLRLWSDAVSM